MAVARIPVGPSKTDPLIKSLVSQPCQAVPKA